jgi:hypothetical protein
MEAASDSDLILHFYEDAPFGKEKDHYFCGASIVNGKAIIIDDEPPKAGEWAGREHYYRIELRDFSAFDEGVPLR